MRRQLYDVGANNEALAVRYAQKGGITDGTAMAPRLSAPTMSPTKRRTRFLSSLRVGDAHFHADPNGTPECHGRVLARAHRVDTFERAPTTPRYKRAH